MRSSEKFEQYLNDLLLRGIVDTRRLADCSYQPLYAAVEQAVQR